MCGYFMHFSRYAQHMCRYIMFEDRYTIHICKYIMYKERNEQHICIYFMYNHKYSQHMCSYIMYEDKNTSHMYEYFISLGNCHRFTHAMELGRGRQFVKIYSSFRCRISFASNPLGSSVNTVDDRCANPPKE